MALFPTKKITALPPVILPLTGFEEFECVQMGNSRKATSRDFVLPTDSLLTISAMGGSLPGSRQMIEGIGIAFVDGGPGSTLSINATGAVAGPANPTAQIGLTPVNGALVTYMRSDAAPALDQSIAPTWTGNHIFAANQNQVRNVLPQWIFVETDAAADNQAWPIRIAGEQFTIGALNDIGSVFTPWVSVDRTGTTIDLVNLQGTTVAVNGQNIRDAAILTSGLVATARLGGGVADATTWLRGDQSWQTLPGGFTGFANPTASVGLATVNGVATTAMRSDAAPALSQAIAPTWTAQHIFSLSGATNAAIFASSVQPQVDWNETDGAANNRRWRFGVQGEQFLGQVVNDANSATANWLTIDRTLNVIDGLTLGINTVSLVMSGTILSTAGQLRSTRVWALNNLTNYGVVVTSADPAIALVEEGVTVNNGIWDIAAIGEQMLFRAVTDGVVSVTNWLVIDRTGGTIDTVTFPSGVTRVTSATSPNLAGANGVSFGTQNNGGSIAWANTTGGVNSKYWDMYTDTTFQAWRVLTDALAAPVEWLRITRSGTTITSVAAPVQGDNIFLVGSATSISPGYQMGVLGGGTRGALIAKGDNTAAAVAIGVWNPATAGDNVFEAFYTETVLTQRGSITYNRAGGLTVYNTTSDARRKKNIRDSRESGDLLDRIQIRSFEWRDSDIRLDYWVVAQELYEVFPIAVTQGTETSDWAVDPSKLVPLMVKELQSIRKRLQNAGL